MTTETTSNTSIASTVAQGDPDCIETLSEVLENVIGRASGDIANFVAAIFWEHSQNACDEEKVKRIKRSVQEILMEDVYVPVMMKEK